MEVYGVDVRVKEVSCRKAGAGGWGNGRRAAQGVARKDARYRLLQTESVMMKAETAQAGD
ncbi:hypothetical protein NB636_05050 [Oxalobacter aliiformigenes]|uniref:hypothetical protein n=1 Tax=Oxalobacter aliiformigenes TaxID=2946593 RepID=UPI0022AF943A|nr:hypothetical protein [Oxalobacter aliiformigenes]MCZ4066014.1 hypothetical protein [Oxalobacter aliiformigenes]WAW00216.1 hypothetical protein NB636_05050 [Oxalobacter aliiformigenes]